MKITKFFIYGVGLLVLVGITLFMVSEPEALPPLLNAILMISLPIFLGIYFARKLGANWNTYAVGAATWGITFVLHLAFNAWLLNPLMDKLGYSATSTGWPLLGAGVLLGFAASLFEETGRLVVYARFMKKSRKWSDGLMLGAGHGGFEAIFFGGLALYTFLQLVVLKDASVSQVAAMVPAESLDATMAQINAFWSAPWYDMLLGSLERVSAMIIHLSMSLMVLTSFRRRNLMWFLAAISWHTLVNTAAVYGMGTWGPYITEAILILLALLSIGIIFSLQRKHPDPKKKLQTKPKPVAQKLSTPKKVTVTKEKLDESQYE